MHQQKSKSHLILNGTIYLLILITFITSLFYYGFYLSTEDRPIENFKLDNASEMLGYKRTVMGTYAGEFEDSSGKGFYLVHNTKKIPVFYLEGYSFADFRDEDLNPDSLDYYTPPQYGEVAVYGFRTDQAIYALNINNQDYNYIIYIVSFLAGIFVLAFFFREWKITWRGFKSA